MKQILSRVNIYTDARMGNLSSCEVPNVQCWNMRGDSVKHLIPNVMTFYAEKNGQYERQYLGVYKGSKIVFSQYLIVKFIRNGEKYDKVFYIKNR